VSSQQRIKGNVFMSVASVSCTARRGRTKGHRHKGGICILHVWSIQILILSVYPYLGH